MKYRVDVTHRARRDARLLPARPARWSGRRSVPSPSPSARCPRAIAHRMPATRSRYSIPSACRLSSPCRLRATAALRRRRAPTRPSGRASWQWNTRRCFFPRNPLSVSHLASLHSYGRPPAQSETIIHHRTGSVMPQTGDVEGGYRVGRGDANGGAKTYDSPELAPVPQVQVQVSDRSCAAVQCVSIFLTEGSDPQMSEIVRPKDVS